MEEVDQEASPVADEPSGHAAGALVRIRRSGEAADHPLRGGIVGPAHDVVDLAGVFGQQAGLERLELDGIDRLANRTVRSRVRRQRAIRKHAVHKSTQPESGRKPAIGERTVHHGQHAVGHREGAVRCRGIVAATAHLHIRIREIQVPQPSAR